MKPYLRAGYGKTHKATAVFCAVLVAVIAVGGVVAYLAGPGGPSIVDIRSQR